eukprot:CAMPEP_0194299090 /NCGR_PEP_ID=MMETSP0169-20130528/60528_1 /TAXON_ID=218684 /ORGANISM="Corethron pennatum, Strain L29A3" /LENGTH=156 /DNA_ID=CAMNT_0039049151 /DNA_START=872 /DNA_END=1339 /DNA_ORIENTATION=+
MNRLLAVVLHLAFVVWRIIIILWRRHGRSLRDDSLQRHAGEVLRAEKGEGRVIAHYGGVLRVVAGETAAGIVDEKIFQRLPLGIPGSAYYRHFIFYWNMHENIAGLVIAVLGRGATVVVGVHSADFRCSKMRGWRWTSIGFLSDISYFIITKATSK